MAKPDPTGQRFGCMVVLGKGEKKRHPTRNHLQQLWQLQCDCGKIIEKPKHKFLSGGHVSCGCKRKLGLVDTGRGRKNITGIRFGDLTAIALTLKVKHSKRIWLLECACGNSRELSYSDIKMLEYSNIRINCGDKSKHPDNYLHYPPTPSPYPEAAAQLLVKYLPETELPYAKLTSSLG